MAWNMAKETVFHIGIKALIFNERKEVLVLRAGPAELKYQKTEFWDLPGGRIQEGSDIKDTLLREIEEELGVSGREIEIGDLFDASMANFKASSDPPLSLMLVTYVCRLKGKHEFKLSDEHSEHRWARIDEAKRLLSNKFAPSFIEKLGKLI